MFLEAISLAQSAHYGQVDKRGKPYIEHCLGVAKAFPGDDLLCTIAVLHDIIEDTWVSFQDLAEQFPLEVVHAVEYLTRREAYGEIYEAFILRVCENPIAVQVKIADLHYWIDRLDEVPLDYQRNRLRRKYTRALDTLCHSQWQGGDC